MPDLYARIVKHLNFPLGMTLRGQGRFYRHYKTLEKIQWRTPDEIQALQWERVTAMMRTAYENSPYWKDVFKTLDAHPDDIKTWDDFRKLPLLTKKELQTHLDEMVDPRLDRSRLIENASGGSTGQPTIFYQNKEGNYRRAMEQIRHDRWTGWDIGEKVALLWGANYDLKKAERWMEKLNNALFFRRIPLDAFDLTEEKMTDYLERIKRQKPTIIQAYAQAISLFAEFIDQNHLTVKPLKLKGIISSAEKLYPFQRALIEKVFGCPVFDRYGSREVGLIASECDRFEGMHLNSDNVVVEFLREDGTPCAKGESGKVVVTCLWNSVTPFLRYDTGDRGIPLETYCSCGRGFPLMKGVEGREADFIKIQNGKIIHGEYFTHIFYGIRGLKQFQLVQTKRQELEFKIVKEDPFDEEKFNKGLDKMKRFIDEPRTHIRISYVKEIPPPKSGKRIFTLSKIK